jgi:hypothetical protein
LEVLGVDLEEIVLKGVDWWVLGENGPHAALYTMITKWNAMSILGIPGFVADSFRLHED